MKPREYAIFLLSKREMCRAEMDKKLIKKYGASENFEELLDELEELDALSDTRFARAQVRHWVLTTRMGAMQMRQKLRQKGVKKEAIEAGLAEYADDEKVENATAVARKRMRDIVRKKPEMSEYEQKMHVRKTLQQKGFSYDETTNALDALAENE